MLLGKISGRVTTGGFTFEAEAKINKLEYVTVKTPEGKWVMAYIDSIVRYGEKTIAEVIVIGHRDERGFLVTPNVPFAPQTPVFSAEEDLIKETLGLPDDGLYIGLLESYGIKVKLPVKHLITKHVSILAKTGSGKSYVAGVLLEELAEKKIPVVVVDPHGEYGSLVRANTEPKELKYCERFDVQPKSYASQVEMFSVENNRLRLDSKLTADELFQCLPVKVSSTQKGLIYSALRNLSGKEYTLRDIINEITSIPSQAKWNLISGLEFLESTKVFSATPTRPKDLVKDGKICILDLKMSRPEIQQMVVFKLLDELFEARKRGDVPGFFLVVEEAHNFCPERGFGEVSSSRVIRNIASEGRKFGLGLCIISQRPARVDKNVLSQCNTQIILKVTNPNDLRAIADSIEGVSQGVKEEIRDLPIGNALIIGVAEQPVLTVVRIRRSKHGGEATQLAGRPEMVKVKNLSFPMKYMKQEIEQEFVGTESIIQINYPLWWVRGTVGGEKRELFIDGLMGEVIYSAKGELQRTAGIRSLAALSSVERSIISHIGRSRFSTMDKIAEAAKLLVSDVQKIVKGLVAKGLLATDGYMYRPAKINIPADILMAGIGEPATETELEGKIVNFSVSRDTALRIGELFGLKADSAEIVYLPYWLLIYSSKKVLVEALTKKVDVVATREVIDLVK